MKNKKQNSLTINELAKYNQEVLLPAIELGIEKKIEKFATKNEFNSLKNEVSSVKGEVSSLKNEFAEFKNESLTNQDKILGKLDKLIEDKDVRNYQDEQNKKFFGIIVKAVEKGKATSDQLEEISKLNVL